MVKNIISAPWRGIKKLWPRQPKSRIIAVAVLVVIIFALIFGYKAFINYMVKQYFATHDVLPTPAVTVSKAKTKDWHSYISSIGTADSIQGVDISPQVSGLVTGILFTSGEDVNQGQPLVKLDDRVLRAQLHQYQANAKLAGLEYQRQRRLFQQKATSAQQLDQAQANLQQNQALVQQYQQLIAQKTIRAPFAGRTGIREVSLGQFLSPGTAITNIQMLAPIYIDYFVPENDVAKIHQGQKVEVSTNAYPDSTFTGKITAIDARVDTETKGVRVQATLPNDEHKLQPGMFVTVHTILPSKKSMVTVPQSAINYTLYGDSVFVIKHKKQDGKSQTIAKQKYVEIGDKRFNLAAITKGLKAGETVIISGQTDLNNNSEVSIQKDGVKLNTEPSS